jgi:DNA-binding HxlR family transcriptional regulator
MVRQKKSRLNPIAVGCPLEDCLKFLAGAWTPKILYYLQSDPRRFGDLKRDLGSISAKVLSTRLKELEERGVILRRVMPTSPPTVEYSLTDLGQKFHPVLRAIVEVGEELHKRTSKRRSMSVPLRTSEVTRSLS